MKKSIYIFKFFFSLSMLMLLFSGCKKFLDRRPLTAILSDYGSVLDVQALGMYKIVYTYGGFNALPWLCFNSFRDDDAQKGSTGSDQAQWTGIFDNYAYSKDESATNAFWGDHYNVINKANDLLYTADSLKLTDAASLKNIGEAYFFRAFCYFDLVKAYGQVPKIDFHYTVASDGIKPKATEAEIYALIDKDLDSAARLLPVTWGNAISGQNPFPGRLSSGAAKALWAQTYLFRKNWSKVLALCNELIASGQYSLLSNYAEIWKDGVNGVGKNSKESIFEFQALLSASRTDATSNTSFWGVTQNIRQGGAGPEWNLGWGFNTPTNKLETDWNSTDPRKAATILYTGQFDGGPASGGYGATLPAGLEQPYWNKKVYSDPAMRAYTGTTTWGFPSWINHRVIRYADIILMKAEAANESGDGATSAAMLELIRNRASGNLGASRTIVPPIAYVDQAQMRTAIKNERRWEFAMEGTRFYDLVRWGDAVSVLAPLGYTNRCRYYPIPQQVIDLSGGVIVQNPEW